MKMWPCCFSFLLVCSLGAAEPLLVGAPGLSHQVNKYLLDRGVSPEAARASGKVYVVRRGDVEEVRIWDVPVELPAPEQLEPAETAKEFFATPLEKRIQDGGVWRIMTPAEQANTPEAVQAGKRKQVKDKLDAEVRAAGFTNLVYGTRDVWAWMDAGTTTLNAAQEKKITRLLQRMESMHRPDIAVREE